MTWNTAISHIVAMALILIGCSACAVPTNSVITNCLPLKSWSDADQDQLRKEYDALPKDAKMRQAFMDYVAMRDADRACQQSTLQPRYLPFWGLPS